MLIDDTNIVIRLIEIHYCIVTPNSSLLAFRCESGNAYFTLNPPKTLSSSSASRDLPVGPAALGAPLDLCGCICSCACSICSFDSSSMFSGLNKCTPLSNQPGATLLFSSNSSLALFSSHTLSVSLASLSNFFKCSCNAMQLRRIASGCAVCPELDCTYAVGSLGSDWLVCRIEGGNVDGRVT